MKHLFSFFFLSALLFSCTNPGIIGVSDAGQISGKYATMITNGDFLYAVNNSQLTTFDMSDSNNPIEIDKKDVGINIENMYISENVLFIGSQTNLHIYAIEENGIPAKKSDTPYVRFSQEVTVCDPVIADQDIAYVTLSTQLWNDDSNCPRLVDMNELRTYHVADLENPVLLETYPMASPQGLSIDGDYLFISNGSAGFSVFEVDHNGKVDLISDFGDFPSYDLYANKGKLLVVSEEEIRQYDYTDIMDIKLYSSLSLR